MSARTSGRDRKKSSRALEAAGEAAPSSASPAPPSSSSRPAPSTPRSAGAKLAQARSGGAGASQRAVGGGKVKVSMGARGTKRTRSPSPVSGAIVKSEAGADDDDWADDDLAPDAMGGQRELRTLLRGNESLQNAQRVADSIVLFFPFPSSLAASDGSVCVQFSMGATAGLATIRWLPVWFWLGSGFWDSVAGGRWAVDIGTR